MILNMILLVLRLQWDLEIDSSRDGYKMKDMNIHGESDKKCNGEWMNETIQVESENCYIAKCDNRKERWVEPISRRMSSKSRSQISQKDSKKKRQPSVSLRVARWGARDEWTSPLSLLFPTHFPSSISWLDHQQITSHGGGVHLRTCSTREESPNHHRLSCIFNKICNSELHGTHMCI